MMLNLTYKERRTLNRALYYLSEAEQDTIDYSIIMNKLKPNVID
jgi:hypothetical protein